MLPARSRMTDAADFRSAMRQGSRSGRATVVVYVVQTGDAESMAGFAVSKAVGGAVMRNRVKRRLRAIMAALLPTLPHGTAVVIRALPRSAEVDFARLRADVTDAVDTARRKAALA
ncbi:ribonuclease P protein component [Demequina activiva]|uniref:Ribonuclease P protein component n=1 Tax=Demequina activiva TaxID=1582364 RepID=A0A919Q1C0_9MICO|nr:ribonuclease P protein component [Demequina activiva]GIG54091.1 ribonuclease P protein component [Demequina activiva]